MAAGRRTGSLDAFRIGAALLVVAIHTSPLASFSDGADFFLCRVLGRLAVPFFLMASGYFSMGGFFERTACFSGTLWPFLKKMGGLYLLSMLLYLPVNVYAGQLQGLSLWGLFRAVALEGTFYHLWYFPGAMLGAAVVYALGRTGRRGLCLAAAAALYLLGLPGDSYYGFTGAIPALRAGYDALLGAIGYTRCGLFYAPLFLTLGALLRERKGTLRPGWAWGAFALALAAMSIEAFLLRAAHWQRHDSMYLLLPLASVCLFAALLATPGRERPALRQWALWVYILHPACILAVRGAARVLGLWDILVEQSLVHYLAVCTLSAVAAGVLTWALKRLRRQSAPRGRAWAEVDLDALAHNVAQLRSALPPAGKLMAVVKADAYGHGAVALGRALCRLGVQSFCVATLDEAVALRRGGVTGEILILGWTDPRQAPLLRRWKLTQTVVDAKYASGLLAAGGRVRVQLKIDTGMHRLGLPWQDTAEICTLLRSRRLAVTGIFTHLATADGTQEEDATFVRVQLRRFDSLLAAIRAQGLEPPCPHAQSSYGLVNFPEAAYGAVRAGVALYGVDSSPESQAVRAAGLRPVMSIHARVAHVVTLPAGESLGYGRAFTAEAETRAAILTIGYADGLPRSLSGSGGYVLLHGRRAPYLGRVCMDMAAVDVTDIPGVLPGDEAVILGRSGTEEIPAAQLSGWARTISNELLSRLGGRMPRCYVHSAPEAATSFTRAEAVRPAALAK